MTGLAGPVVFWTSIGREVGLGHLRRCLHLALAIRSEGGDPEFRIRGGSEAPSELESHAIDAIVVGERTTDYLRNEQPGRRLAAVVLDDYELTSEDFRRCRGRGHPVVVLDDSGEIEEADLVVNPSFTSARYAGAALTGPRYALIDPCYAELRRQPSDRVGRVLVTMGGSDLEGLTARVTKLVGDTLRNVAIDTVIGPYFSRDCARQLLGLDRVEIHEAPKTLVPLVAGADIAVSSGGVTLYELAAGQVPTIALEVADNQAGNVAGLEAAGAIVATTSRNEDLAAALARLAKSTTDRRAMAAAGRTLVDGKGALRVARAILAAGRGERDD